MEIIIMRFATKLIHNDIHIKSTIEACEVLMQWKSHLQTEESTDV